MLGPVFCTRVLGVLLLTTASWPQKPVRSAERELPAVIVVRRESPQFERCEQAFRAIYAGRVVDSIVLKRRISRLDPRRFEHRARNLVIFAIGSVAMHEVERLGRTDLRVACAGTLGEPRAPRVRWFHPLDIPAVRRLEILLKYFPRIKKVGILARRHTIMRERGAIRAFEKQVQRDLVEFVPVKNRAQSILAVRKFSKDVRVLLLLPDHGATPLPGKRLEIEFQRALLEHGLFVVGLGGKHITSCSLYYLEPDFSSLGEQVARAIMEDPGGIRGVVPPSPRYVPKLRPDVMERFGR